MSAVTTEEPIVNASDILVNGCDTSREVEEPTTRYVTSESVVKAAIVVALPDPMVMVDPSFKVCSPTTYCATGAAGLELLSLTAPVTSDDSVGAASGIGLATIPPKVKTKAEYEAVAACWAIRDVDESTTR